MQLQVDSGQPRSIKDKMIDFRKTLKLFCILAMCIGSQSAFADAINSTTPGAGWVSGWSNGESGSTFFNNTSWDGSKKNVGYCLTGGGNCTLSSTPGALAYFGVGNQAASNISFINNGNPVSTATLQIEIAGYAGTNVFGWYDLTTGNRTVIFNGPDSAGKVISFTPTVHYGFYIQANGNGAIYYTESNRNSSDVGFQHFAAFLGTPADTYWLGIEDLAVGPNGTGDRDYNDMVVKVTSTAAPVPEPASLALFGSGLISAAAFGRKKLLRK
jgi:hypothetical protein